MIGSSKHIQVKQTTGQNKRVVMSQKAVTDMDVTVTSEKVIDALGYTPADEETVNTNLSSKANKIDGKVPVEELPSALSTGAITQTVGTSTTTAPSENAVKNELQTKSTIVQNILSNQLIDINNGDWVAGAYLNGAIITNHVDYTYSNTYFDLSLLAGQVVYSNWFKLVQYDANKTFISNSNASSFTLAANCKYVRVCLNVGAANMTSQETIIARLIVLKGILLLGNTYNVSQYDLYVAEKYITDTLFKLKNGQISKNFVLPENLVKTESINAGAVSEIKLDTDLALKINNKISGKIGRNLCIQENCLSGKYYNNTGALTSIPAFPEYGVTELIPIVEGQIIRCNSNHGSAYNVLFDANRVKIAGSAVLSTSQQYLVGTAQSAYVAFSIDYTKIGTIMVEVVSSTSSLSSDYEPYNVDSELVNPYSFEKSILHPLQKILMPYYGLKWASLTDSIGVGGIAYYEYHSLYTRAVDYSYRVNTGWYGWQRYVADHLQLGGHICNPIASSTIAINTNSPTNQYFVTSARISLMPSDAKLIVVMGGTNDHFYSSPIGDLTYSGGYNENTYKGAIASLITKLHIQSPNALIVMLTPLYASRNANGMSTPVNSLGLVLKDYRDAMIDVCQRMATPCIDVYGESGINERNSSEYLIADGVHPYSNKGMAKLATCIVAGLNRFRPNLIEL